jgi:hypothetical protein
MLSSSLVLHASFKSMLVLCISVHEMRRKDIKDFMPLFAKLNDKKLRFVSADKAV